MLPAEVTRAIATKIHRVVRDQCVVIGNCELDELPILGAGPSTIAYAGRLDMSARYDKSNEFRALTLIDQQSKCHAVTRLTTRFTRRKDVAVVSASRRGRPLRGCTSS